MGCSLRVLEPKGGFPPPKFTHLACLIAENIDVHHVLQLFLFLFLSAYRAVCSDKEDENVVEVEVYLIPRLSSRIFLLAPPDNLFLP